MEDGAVAIRSTEGGDAIKTAIGRERETGAGGGSFLAAGKGVQGGEDSVGGDAKDRAVTIRSTVGGGSVEGAVVSEDETGLGKVAVVVRVKRVEHGKPANGGDAKNFAVSVKSPEFSDSVKGSVRGEEERSLGILAIRDVRE